MVRWGADYQGAGRFPCALLGWVDITYYHEAGPWATCLALHSRAKELMHMDGDEPLERASSSSWGEFLDELALGYVHFASLFCIIIYCHSLIYFIFRDDI
jgi:hypothetical protein